MYTISIIASTCRLVYIQFQYVQNSNVNPDFHKASWSIMLKTLIMQKSYMKTYEFHNIDSFRIVCSDFRVLIVIVLKIRESCNLHFGLVRSYPKDDQNKNKKNTIDCRPCWTITTWVVACFPGVSMASITACSNIKPMTSHASSVHVRMNIRKFESPSCKFHVSSSILKRSVISGVNCSTGRLRRRHGLRDRRQRSQIASQRLVPKLARVSWTREGDHRFGYPFNARVHTKYSDVCPPRYIHNEGTVLAPSILVKLKSTIENAYWDV